MVLAIASERLVASKCKIDRALRCAIQAAYARKPTRATSVVKRLERGVIVRRPRPGSPVRAGSGQVLLELVRIYSQARLNCLFLCDLRKSEVACAGIPLGFNASELERKSPASRRSIPTHQGGSQTPRRCEHNASNVAEAIAGLKPRIVTYNLTDAKLPRDRRNGLRPREKAVLRPPTLDGRNLDPRGTRREPHLRPGYAENELGYVDGTSALYDKRYDPAIPIDDEVTNRADFFALCEYFVT